jgi:hypothetical protein
VSAGDVETLVAEGVLARVPPDRAEAQRELDAAVQHFRGAEAAAEVDPTGAFSLTYDAARKATVAHMRSSGVRIIARFGVHYQTTRYARTVLAGRGIDEHLEAFAAMREVRNDTECEAAILAHSDAREALGHARAIVVTVQDALA